MKRFDALQAENLKQKSLQPLGGVRNSQMRIGKIPEQSPMKGAAAVSKLLDPDDPSESAFQMQKKRYQATQQLLENNTGLKRGVFGSGNKSVS